MYSLENYFYELPPELIAHYPCHPRSASRLLVIERKTGRMHEMMFHDLTHFLEKGDSLIFNDSKVFPSRLLGNRPSGGKAEVLLIKKTSEGTWEALVKPGKKLGIGSKVIFGDGFSCEIVDVLPDGRRIVHLDFKGDINEALDQFGHIPLPVYIRRPDIPEVDKISYQTVYAKNPGSVAAPTAGLHFTQEMLNELGQKGISQHHLTLHVGLGTFLPVKAENIREHKMHVETFSISKETADQLNNKSKDKRNICVGTTTCRALESVANNEGIIQAGLFDTDIFIYPGYKFKYVNHLLTNFHQPGSSLLMLVCAFAGYELIMEAYQKAIKERFRFFSYGDAMLIL